MTHIGGAMSKQQKLPPVEWEIMEAIWDLGGKPSVREVIDRIYPNGEKAYTTVQTIMNNLVKKGVLKREKIGMVNFYTPTRSRLQMVKAEMSNLVSRVFHGSVPALANYLIHSERLTLEEIDEIKILLDQKVKTLQKEST